MWSFGWCPMHRHHHPVNKNNVDSKQCLKITAVSIRFLLMSSPKISCCLLKCTNSWLLSISSCSILQVFHLNWTSFRTWELVKDREGCVNRHNADGRRGNESTLPKDRYIANKHQGSLVKTTVPTGNIQFDIHFQVLTQYIQAKACVYMYLDMQNYMEGHSFIHNTLMHLCSP